MKLAPFPKPIKISAGFNLAGYRILVRETSNYLPDKVIHDCLAVKLYAS